MLPSFLLAFREGVEAALVIGIVLGVVRKLGRADCSRVVWYGVGSAVVVSALIAFALHASHRSMSEEAEPIVEGVLLFVAAGLLTWMLAWMNRHAAGLRVQLEGEVRQAVCTPGIGGVFAVGFIAVAREGTELALFLTAAGVGTNGTQTLIGAISGLAAAVLLAWALFATTTRLGLKRFFQLTTALLVLFAAGLVAKGIHEFNEAGWIPALLEPVWNSRAVLDESSVTGATARALFGYTSTPSLTAAIGYALYLAVSLALFRSGAGTLRVRGEQI